MKRTRKHRIAHRTKGKRKAIRYFEEWARVTLFKPYIKHVGTVIEFHTGIPANYVFKGFI